MKQVVRNISLDFSRRSNTRVMYATQSDVNARIFMITLYDDGYLYIPEAGATATINVRRADGLSTAFVGKIFDDGRVRYIAGPWALGVVGVTLVSVSIYDSNNKKLTTCPFSIDVGMGVYLGSSIKDYDESESLFDSMVSLVSSLNESEEQRVFAETVRCDQESTRIENEANRNLQESWRVERENTRIANEEKRCEITDAIATAIDNLLAIQANLL